MALGPVDAALASPTLRGAHVGVYAVDTATGRTLYQRDPGDDFVPASTFKLIVGSAALSRLGPAFTFRTTVEATGDVEHGTLGGDLTLSGGGDAELSAADLDAAAAAVAQAGITHVAGALIGDATRYRASHYPPGWAVDDVPYGYAAVPSALSYDLNVAHVRVSPGPAPGLPAVLQASPADGAFAIENDTVTGLRASDDTTDVKRAWERPQTIRVVGSYPLGAPLSDDLEPSLPDPAAYALAAFAQALAQRGVRVDGAPRLGAAPAGARVLWSHDSKPLAGVLADCWQPSLNLLAEQMLLELGAGAPGDTRLAGIAVENAWLQSIGIDPATVTIADGSGLSAYDRVTPRDLVTILQTDWHGPQRAVVLAALPLAGERGTLQSTFVGTPLAGRVYAKTGTVNHSRLLAGYLERPDGDGVTFAIMVNDWMDDSSGARAALHAVWARILEAL